MPQRPPLRILHLPDNLRATRRAHLRWDRAHERGADHLVESKPATYLYDACFERRLQALGGSQDRDVAQDRWNLVVAEGARDLPDQILLDFEVLAIGGGLAARRLISLAPVPRLLVLATQACAREPVAGYP